MLIVFLIPALLLAISAIDNNFSQRSLLMLVTFAVIGVGCFLGTFVGSGPEVCLKDDCVATPGGRAPIRLFYDQMDSCTMGLDSFKGKNLPS